VTRIPSVRFGAAVALAGVALAVASCSSGPGASSGSAGGSASGSTTLPPDTTLKQAATKVLAQVTAYMHATSHCATQPNPVVCVEAADRTLGGQVHAYANVLAVGHGFTAPVSVVTAARNQAQTLANSLEILGDAQPTQANYNQVLNTFNLPAAIDQFKSAVVTLDAHLGG
jgi:hypothetical protein